ncbi:MFS transporter [Paenibacillus sp. IB182496]|uniref:MFS transporter n=1 Tax=Paenibacillus sabuli TaxID=2772509 RepID=A0A927BQ72_9BACL|nr:MFS transporter [Paenibacillus sabuli]MBD2843670.1 MFS transporter [Paenibacillus sabuli]
MITHSEPLPAAQGLSKPEKRKIIALLCTVLLFSVMNSTMFMIAVPEIAAYFVLTPSQVSWVVTGYIILYGIGALIYGKLADLYPFRSLLTVGLLLFAAGSAVGFFADHFMMVVAARMIQATGAAAVPAMAFIAPARYFPDEKGKVLGIASSTMAFASGVGPVIGGFVSGAYGWPYLFLISSLVVFTIPFFRMWLPREAPKPGRVDFFGALLLAVSIGAFILMITTFLWWLLPVSLVFAWLFYLRTRRAAHPFVSLDLFRNASFRSAILTGFLGMLTLFSIMFVMPLYLAEFKSLSTTMVGLVMFPGAMSSALIGRSAGAMTDRRGSLPVVYIAFGLMCAGFLLTSTFIGAHVAAISAVLILCMVSFPFFQASTASLVSTTLPADQIGVGMGIYNLCNFMAGAFGGAIIGRILDFGLRGAPFNPFSFAEGGESVYSNLFLGITALTVLNAIIFYFRFGRDRASSPGG